MNGDDEMLCTRSTVEMLRAYRISPKEEKMSDDEKGWESNIGRERMQRRERICIQHCSRGAEKTYAASLVFEQRKGISHGSQDL